MLMKDKLIRVDEETHKKINFIVGKIIILKQERVNLGKAVKEAVTRYADYLGYTEETGANK